MIDTTIKETARQRAQRIWRNNFIQHYNIIDDTSDPDWNKIIEEDKQLNTIRARVSHEVRKIIYSKNTEIVTHYIISLRERRRRLLKEKLARLQKSETNE
jgi:hypothetical protein